MSKMLESIKKINFKNYLNFLIYFFAIVVGSIVIDQVSKVIAMNFLPYGEPVAIIPNFIEFTLVFNKGAAFGMGDDVLWIRIVFVLLSWIVAFFILGYSFYLMYKGKKINTFFGVILALILGGDIGNLIDRTFFFNRGVVDFISVQSWLPNFGIFNIADSCLVVGILLLILYFIIDEFKANKEEKEHKANLKKLEANNTTQKVDEKDIINKQSENLNSNQTEENGK